MASEETLVQIMKHIEKSDERLEQTGKTVYQNTDENWQHRDRMEMFQVAAWHERRAQSLMLADIGKTLAKIADKLGVEE